VVYVIYGTNTQYIEEKEDNTSLSPKEVNRLQKLDGALIYYARVVDPPFIIPVNLLAS
jgi:hypothetical protein